MEMEKDIAKNGNVTLSKKNDKIIFDTAEKLLKSSDLDLSILKGVNTEQKKVLMQKLKEMEKKEKKGKVKS